MKWRVFETLWRNVQKCRYVKNGGLSVMKFSEVQWSSVNEVMILGEMCVLSLIYMYTAVCMFCAVRCLFAYLSCYFKITRLMFFNILCVFGFLFCVFRVFISLCLLLLLWQLAVPFVFLYKFTDRCHQVQTRLQSINIISYIVFIVSLYRKIAFCTFSLGTC